jgi:hypothetical protein
MPAATMLARCLALVVATDGAAAQEMDRDASRQPSSAAKEPSSGGEAPESGGTMQPEGAFVLAGAHLSLALDRADGPELSVGGEVSVAHLTADLFWAGSYLDGVYSTRSDEWRMSIGPEIGFGFLGLDAGYVLKLGGEHSTQHGIVVRPMLTAGVVTAFFRSAWLFGEHGDWSGEVGILVKLSIEL